MKKLLKSKKGSTDSLFMVTYVVIFVLLGSFLPLIGDSFGETISEGNVDKLEEGLGQDIGFADLGDATDVISNIIKMFFWTFGQIPWWLDLVFVIIRIHFWYMVIRLFRGVS